MLLLLLAHVLQWLLLDAWRPRRAKHIRRATVPSGVTARRVRSHPKPPWIGRELVRIKAWSPEMGCRAIAEVFNRQFADRRVSVGKTYVAALLRKRKLDVLRLRRTMKHRVPRPMARDRVWGLDLTGKTDLSGRQTVILGLLDHGTRACLRLSVLADKSSLTILREFVGTFRCFGVPKTVRVDNEACLVSRTMCFALALLGVRLQRIAPRCPWQNGRIERFFGTLKQRLDRNGVADVGELRCKLVAFRCWYNHVRAHQHLGGHTPAEVWEGRSKSKRRPHWFSAWEGRLTGWYFPP